MGSLIELNDTLQITTEQGFPSELHLQQHRKLGLKVKDFLGKEFSFIDKPSMRIFHPAPTRVFLVHNIGGKRLYQGHCNIVEQTIDARTQTTSGKFTITKIYSPEIQKVMSRNEVPQGCAYLG